MSENCQKHRIYEVLQTTPTFKFMESKVGTEKFNTLKPTINRTLKFGS